MNPRVLSFFVFLFLVAVSHPLPALDIDWAGAPKNPNLQVTTATENGTPVLGLAYTNHADALKGQVAFVTAPFHVPAGSTAQGLSFEVRGDGSSAYASILLTHAKPSFGGTGYEAIFPLDGKDWKKITLRWDDFVQNYLPWAKMNVNDDTRPVLDPAKIAFIGFGEGRYFIKFYPRQADFSIRNIQLVDEIPAPQVPAFSPGWTHVKSLLGTSRKINILLLGDSITDFGDDHSYGYFLGQKIKQTWGNDCVVANCGIRGHSIRGGIIVLPRSLRTMPDPDLVCILYGANDSTALGLKSEFNEQVFKQETEELIDKVRIGTNGNADICLVTGDPRHLKETVNGVAQVSPKSNGLIEKIIPAFKEAAAERQTAYADTFSRYLTITPDQQKQYYRPKDIVHQSPAGLEFMGDLVFDQLQANVKAAR
jgi:lysophospholipase L1-like esterase